MAAACVGSSPRRTFPCTAPGQKRFDDLVLQAVARLEPRWEAHLAGVEFAVEEIPPAGDAAAGPVPLARLEPGSGGAAGGFAAVRALAPPARARCPARPGSWCTGAR